MKPGVKLRCDGNSEIGLGHVYRMMALHDILEEHFDCSFILKNSDRRVAALLEKKNYKFQILDSDDIDLPLGNACLEYPITEQEILVLDGYRFDSNFQKRIKGYLRCPIVCVDDLVANPFVADVIINHSGGVAKEEYQIEPGSKLLLGPEYAILRKEFYQLNPPRRIPKSIGTVFIGFGGADPDNATCQAIVDITNRLGDSLTKINVVLGAVFEHESQLQALINKFDCINVFRNIDASQMITLMQEADLAVCSSSTIAYEYCCVSGLLVIKKIADNQSRLFQFLTHNNLALPYEQLLQPSTNLLHVADEIIENQKKYFDGQAGLRLEKEFTRLFLQKNLVVRKASQEDIDIYFRWANDPEVRKNSFSSEVIDYQTHTSWFKNHLGSKESSFYIFFTGDQTPVGNVRFKIENDLATLSYLIDEKFRGLGLGKEIILRATKEIFKEYNHLKRVNGLVKTENIASIKAFISAGYEEDFSNEKNVRRFYKTEK